MREKRAKPGKTGYLIGRNVLFEAGAKQRRSREKSRESSDMAVENVLSDRKCEPLAAL